MKIELLGFWFGIGWIQIRNWNFWKLSNFWKNFRWLCFASKIMPTKFHLTNRFHSREIGESKAEFWTPVIFDFWLVFHSKPFSSVALYNDIKVCPRITTYSNAHAKVQKEKLVRVWYHLKWFLKFYNLIEFEYPKNPGIQPRHGITSSKMTFSRVIV